MPEERLYILDAHWLLYQAFHALPAMTGPTGEPTQAVFGFTRDLLNIVKNRQPQYLVCAFDGPGPTFRHGLYADYKANRGPMPDDLIPQIPRVHEVLEAFQVPALTVEGYEADDVIGTVATQAAARGLEVYICTNDKDARQLVGERIFLYNPRTDTVIGPAEVEREFGVRPEQIVDYLALAGDASDNVPGVRGVGPKTAAKLIQTYGSLEAVLAKADQIQAKRLRETLLADQGAASARLSRQLVTIQRNVPVELDWEACRTRPPAVERLAPVFQALGFRRFLEEIGRNGQAARPATAAFRWELIDTEPAYGRFLDQLRAQRRFCLDLETTSLEALSAEIVGMAFCWEPSGGAYLALRTPPGRPHLDSARVLADLRPLLEDASIAKVGQNLKYDALVLRSAQVRLAGIAFDTMVASYLLEAGQRNHNLDDLAMRYLGHRLIPIQELIGRGKDQITMDRVEPARVAEYSVEDAVVAWRLAEILEPALREAGLWSLFAEVEMPLVDVLTDMEHTGIRVDPTILADLSQEYGRRLKALEAEIYAAAGHEFNIGSPKQLAEVLFEELHLPRVRKTKTGYSTDQEVLEELAPLAPLARLILEHRQLAKLKSTYLDALGSMIHPKTGRVHASFNQGVTATGRLSSSEPNLQNIPIRSPQGREIRRAFVPGRKDQVLLTADYSQIELRVLAHYSEDPAMMEAFRHNRDIHAAVAARIYGVEPTQVTPDMRRSAKAVNFGIIYGLSPFGLARQLGITQTAAADFIDAYFRHYAGIETFIEKTLEAAREKGFVTTILGRRRAITGIRHTDARNRGLPERTAVNTVIQGSAADLIKVAMNRIHRRLRQEGRRTRMLLQIHDELVFEVFQEDLQETIDLVRAEMTQAIPLRVPLAVDVAYGPNWMEVA